MKAEWHVKDDWEAKDKWQVKDTWYKKGQGWEMKEEWYGPGAEAKGWPAKHGSRGGWQQHGQTYAGEVSWKVPGQPWKKTKVEDDSSTRRLGTRMQHAPAQTHRHFYMSVYYIYRIYASISIDFLHTARLQSYIWFMSVYTIRL